MKRSGYRSIFHIYIIFFILVLGMLAAGFGMILYNITIQKPDGQIGITRWPIDFTRDFSQYISTTDGRPQITQPGLNLLRENHLWLQLLNASGDEVLNVDKPQEIPAHYSPSNLLDIVQNGTGNQSVFSGRIQSGKTEWTYIIGFPIPIAKITTYVNKDRFNTLKPIVWVMFGIALVLLTICTIVYSLIVTRQMDHIRRSIRDIATRTFSPTKNKGSFGDIYAELNALNQEIKTSDEVRARNEKLREEWIANITHDLKTPLSPIRGYAELIAGADAKTPRNEIGKYGGIILKNAAYAEELIDDLKLTFQLKNEMLTLNKAKRNIARFLKELAIDLLNDPDYQQREIIFSSEKENISFSFDPILLKRAFNNLLTNALVHNSAETKISVSIRVDDKIRISIQDTGYGMSKEELDQLFVRYYRGSNSDSKPEGSGLGMAIAKQIIEQHGGNIQVDSHLEAGTCITVEFPHRE